MKTALPVKPVPGRMFLSGLIVGACVLLFGLLSRSSPMRILCLS
ncbi:hypothetical protein [Methanomassiliicoccus luminyensis]|nr:hypothetical protein [Methanomassiliicoccus luminyensis]